MKKKKILIIFGHSHKGGLCNEITDEYEKGARKSGAEIKRINIGDLKFDPILYDGYRRIQKLEPDLIQSQKDIKWANHIVLVYPVWWASMPALLKGFFDRVFLPGFAFHFKGVIRWDRLLKGRTAELLISMGAAKIYYKLTGSLSEKVMKNIFHFCGIKIKRTAIFDLAQNMNSRKKEKFLKKAYKLGKNN